MCATVAVYYILGMTSAVTPILFPWVHMILKDDNEARSFVVGAMVRGQLVRDPWQEFLGY